LKKSISIWIFICLVFSLSLLQAQDVSGSTEKIESWKAGIAKVVITPQEYMWMAGYAARDKPAEGKLHDLWAKALALEDAEGNRVLLIITDIIGFSRDLSLSICDRLKKEYSLERKNIILSSSHTHSGPVININLEGIYPLKDDKQKKQIENYRTFIEEKIIAIAGKALNSLEPARLSSGTGIARFAVNRRENKANEEFLYLPEVNGPSDHVVQVINVSDTSDQPMAVVFGYSCHATCLDINMWSGDYPGFAQVELEKIYPGITSMFFAGFGADQNPIPRRSIPLARQYGKELAIAVEKVVEEPIKLLSPSIRTIYNEIDLDLVPPPGIEKLKEVAEEGNDWQRTWAENMKKKIISGQEFPDSYPFYPVQSLQLGEQTLVVLGGEVVVDYAFLLRDTLGNDLMIMAYANDVMTYIPSERILKEGDYEGETSMWVYGHHGTWLPGLEKKILNEVIRQVALIRNERF